jgi:uncharacterized ion transporter superfamily protein YfcC
MKIFIPKHIPKWFFSVNFQIWPFSIWLIQLFIVAIGAAISLMIRNQTMQRWIDRMVATLLALPVMIIFLVIAFFNVSEMGLLEFITKLIRTYFLDVALKYQVNYDKIDILSVLLGKIKSNDHDLKLNKKTEIIDKEAIQKIKDNELVSS